MDCGRKMLKIVSVCVCVWGWISSSDRSQTMGFPRHPWKAEVRSARTAWETLGKHSRGGGVHLLFCAHVTLCLRLTVQNSSRFLFLFFSFCSSVGFLSPIGRRSPLAIAYIYINIYIYVTVVRKELTLNEHNARAALPQSSAQLYFSFGKCSGELPFAFQARS